MTSPLLPTYARIELAFERGDGAWLTSTAGKRFLDFGGACIESKFNGSVREREIDRGLPPW